MIAWTYVSSISMFVRTLAIHQSYTKRVRYVYHEASKALAADPGEDVLVDLAGLLQVREVARVLDHDHPREWRQEALGAKGQVHPDAAIGGPVQIEGGLRRLAPGRLLLGLIPVSDFSRAASRSRTTRRSPGRPAGIARRSHRPVVADGGGQVGRLPQALL